ncbi:MAG: SH3 domain-containing protein [Spirochaetes bacterium]|nr:SH3 domain-containing protein [Spirochaetota bacterium]
MKRIIIFSIMVFAAILFFSCGRSEDAQDSVRAIAGDGTAEPAVAPGGWRDGYVLRLNSAFYTLENDTDSETDRVRWIAGMSLGERVQMGEIRRATFPSDGRVHNFVKVRRDNGNEGFGWTTQVVEAGALAVVIDDRANLFTSPRAVDVTGTILSRKTVVVLYPDTERDGFVKVRAFDPIAQANRQNQFVRTASLSRRTSDIQASILLQTALPLATTGAAGIRREALLESAFMDFPDSVFRADIQVLIDPNAVADATPPVPPRTEPVTSAFMLVISDNVNVRDFPDQNAGRVIDRLSKDEEVTVSERTAENFTIGGDSARWYRVTTPLEGWVFGVFLE